MSFVRNEGVMAAADFHIKRGIKGLLSVPSLLQSGLKNSTKRKRGGQKAIWMMNMPGRLDIDVRRVAELYKQGFSTRRIGRMLGYSKSPVLRRLHELGIKLRGRRVDVDVEKIVKLYERGFSSREIARALNCPKTTVLRSRHESGVKLRSKTGELPDLNPGGDLAYVLGVACGGGKKRTDGLHLWVKDRDFAEAFAEACESLGFKPRRYFREKEEVYEVSVYSIEFGRWLKSLSYERVGGLLTDEEAKKAFVRGYFDSDGCAIINPVKKCRNSIKFGDPNPSLLELVARICSNLGIETSFYGPYRGNGKRSMYELYVHARSRRRFSEIIGSSLGRKREALEKIARFYS